MLEDIIVIITAIVNMDLATNQLASQSFINLHNVQLNKIVLNFKQLNKIKRWRNTQLMELHMTHLGIVILVLVLIIICNVDKQLN